MSQELSRVPRSLSEKENSRLIERLYETGGSSNVAMDLIVYLTNNQMKNLFGENWFTIADFCKVMGYDRTKLHRKLTEEQIIEIFGKNNLPKYIRTVADGQEVVHNIETVFEAALYRLGSSNIAIASRNSDGSTSYKFVQIIMKFDIKTDFTTKKGTKRLYNAVLNPMLTDSLFKNYNLIDLQDYRKIPDRIGYRYFYLNLAKMMYVIKNKMIKGQAPVFTLTVDQLAKIFDIQIANNNDRKKKVRSILNLINSSLEVTNFQFDFIKSESEKWAYTVQFYFPNDTLEYFDQKFTTVFTSKFYTSLVWKYVETLFPNIYGVGRSDKVQEVMNNEELYNEFLKWAHSDENIELKEELYRSTFTSVFQRSPEDFGLEIFNFG